VVNFLFLGGVTMKHQQIWQAIDNVAATCGFSVSALAKHSGLDPTTFNRSKRTSHYGKERWPSTESLNKILNYLGMSMFDFVNQYLNENNASLDSNLIPLIKFSNDEFNRLVGEDGNISNYSDNKIIFHNYSKNLYAIEITSSSMEPVYRKGDRLIVCPQSPIRRGDRVILKNNEGIFAYELINQSATKIECKLIGSQETKILNASDVKWIVRIFWTEYSL